MAKRPAPTKANLFATQKRLKFASEGAELLHQKRDVLVMELMGIVAEFGEVESALRKALAKSSGDFISAKVQMGQAAIARVLTLHRNELEVDIERRSVMGITLPEVSLEGGNLLEQTGFLETVGALDKTIDGLVDFLDTLERYIEIVASVWKLTLEIEKTQKRINALENIFIPESSENIRWIKDAMEQNEREELFRLKRLSGNG